MDPHGCSRASPGTLSSQDIAAELAAGQVEPHRAALLVQLISIESFAAENDLDITRELSRELIAVLWRRRVAEAG